MVLRPAAQACLFQRKMSGLRMPSDGSALRVLSVPVRDALADVADT